MMNGMISCATITLTAGLSLNRSSQFVTQQEDGQGAYQCDEQHDMESGVCRAPDVHPVILSAEVAKPARQRLLPCHNTS